MYPGHFAAKYPDRPACIMADTGEVVTFAELEARSNQGAQLFRSLGLSAGDCVAIFMENNARFMEICWAAHRAGLYYTCIATHLTPPEVSYIVDDCDARVFITSEAKASLLPTEFCNTPHLYMTGTPTAGYTSWDTACRAMLAEKIADETEGHDFLYSSGTTGRPKGVRIALTGVAFGAPGEHDDTVRGISGNPGEGDLMFSPAPLYHAAPLRFCMTMHRYGAGCLIAEKFDAENSLRLIETYRCTHSLWVPTMFVRMLKLPAKVRNLYDVSTMRAAMHGAAPCAVEIKQAMIDWFGPVLLEYYGATEGNGLCLIDSEEALTHPGSVGKAVIGELHVLDEDDNELPPGVDGTVYFGDAQDFTYYKDEDKTQRSHSEQGWSTLGDIGHVDDAGYLYLIDRKAFMIISGGVNIYPQEAENRLVTHPAVLDVAVIGVPDDDLGESVKAVVQLVDPATAGPQLEADLLSYCREALSPVKCPRSVDFEETLPREANGKLYKRLLRDRYWGLKGSRII